MNRNTDTETEAAMTLSLCMQPLTPIYTGSLSRQCNYKFGHAAGFPPRNGLKSLIGIILRTGKKTDTPQKCWYPNNTTPILSAYWSYPKQYYYYPISPLEVSYTILLLSCQSSGGIPNTTTTVLLVCWRYPNTTLVPSVYRRYPSLLEPRSLVVPQSAEDYVINQTPPPPLFFSSPPSLSPFWRIRLWQWFV